MTKQADWSRWSEPQLCCLLALDFAVPLHLTHLRKRYKVRSNTLTSLIDRGLVRKAWLSEDEGQFAKPFLTLTREGLAVKRDYVNWHRKLHDCLEQLPNAMTKIAETRL